MKIDQKKKEKDQKKEEKGETTEPPSSRGAAVGRGRSNQGEKKRVKRGGNTPKPIK